MSKTICLFGGSFNPPTFPHRLTAVELSKYFDEVKIIPCGSRPDKATVGDVEPIHRAIMCDMTFGNIPGVTVELFDLEQSTFTPNDDLQRIYGSQGEVWHAVGTDIIKDGKSDESLIHTIPWKNMPSAWDNLNFAVIERSGYEVDHNDFPPHHRFIRFNEGGSSTEVRNKVFNRQPINGLVLPTVEDYIERYNLYRGRLFNGRTRFYLRDPRAFFIVDRKNDLAVTLSDKDSHVRSDDPNHIRVYGGDGAMLHAIRDHWHKRLPFIGVNAGHRGLLLNSSELILNNLEKMDGEFILYHSPLLYVELEDVNGQVKSALAFNDAWVERAGHQTAWIEHKVSGIVRIPKLVCDGILVSTPAGSTAYARAMGATPIRIGEFQLVVAGSNVLEPPGWKSANHSMDSVIEVRSLDPNKRPIRALVDGIPQGEVLSMKVRVSNIGAVEIGFDPREDMAEKFANMQYPPIVT